MDDELKTGIMEHNDREYRQLMDDGLRNVAPSDDLRARVRDAIARNVTHTRHRNTALGTIALVIVATMVLSSVTPVFGRNGTLPQVITAMTAERQAQKATRRLGTTTVQQTSAALLVPEATVRQSQTVRCRKRTVSLPLSWLIAPAGRWAMSLLSGGRDMAGASSWPRSVSQGTIANVIAQAANNPAGEPMIGAVVLAEPCQPAFYWILPASVLQDADHHVLTLAALQALPNLSAQKVTIHGKLLADGSVGIVNLTVTTVTGNATPDPVNPGKGKSGKD